MPPEPDTGTAASGRLAGRRILITGGASGIGATTARLFAREGAGVALLDRDASRAGEVAREAGGVAFGADVADAAEVEDVVARAAAALGGLDGVVNAAGTGVSALFAQTSLADWKRSLDINLTGPFLVSQAALPYLLAAEGATIVNLASGAGLLPNKGRAAYGASKGGLIALGKVMALELAPRVRVNTLAPGAVDTPFVRNTFTTDDAVAAVAARFAMQRLARPEEAAEAILFLTSAQSSFVTGATLVMDGGRTFH